MQKTLELFIGSNNTTHKVELDKLEQVLSKYHEGFTIKHGIVGYWHGVREETVTVIIADNYTKILKTINELKSVLDQEAIAYHEVAQLEFI